jgi:voltage-gated potassium channel
MAVVDLADGGRRELLRSIARIVASSGLVLAAFYLVPVTERDPGPAWIRLAIATVAFAAVLAWEVRAIVRSRHPYIRAGAALGMILPVFIGFFAWTYLNLSAADPSSFSLALTRTQALYFTITVISTVGFGDITPATDAARLVVAFQMLADLVLIGAVARLIFHAASVGRERRAPER